MKKLLLASVMMLSITLSANNAKNTLDSVKTTVESVLPDSTQLTFKEVYNDIKIGLSGLAAGLKVGSEKVYEILVTQQYINGLMFVSILLFGLILFIYWISCFYSKHRYKIKNKYNRETGQDENYIDKTEWNDAHITKTTLLGIISCILLIIGLLYFDVILTGFLNPEYGAIKEILTFIK